MWGFQQDFQWWMPFFGMGMMLFGIMVVGFVVWGIIRFRGRGRNPTLKYPRPLISPSKRHLRCAMRRL